MFMNIMAILLLLAVGYVWSARGWFNALINLIVVVTAGAVALGFWEQIAESLVKGSDSRFVQDVVWGMSLLMPFALVCAALSLLTRVTIRNHLKPITVIDYIGGAVCGLAAGVIVSGFVVISTSMMRLAPDFMNWTPVTYDQATGCLVRRDPLWTHVDQLTAEFYGFTSERAFATGTPLEKWRPQLSYEGHLLRASEDEGLPRYSLKPTDLDLVGRYTVGAKGGEKLSDLVGDNKPILTVDPDKTVEGTFLANGKIGSPASIEGYVVLFKAGAKEKGGQVLVGAGSATLVLRSPGDDESLALQPIAVISKAKGESPDIGRWRLDTAKFFIGSVGGTAQSAFAFEFLVPKRGDGEWQPVALYVRGVRFNLTDPETDTVVYKPAAVYEKVEDRERDRESQDLFAKATTRFNLDPNAPGYKPPSNTSGLANPVRVSKTLPGNIVIDGTTNPSGLSVNSGNMIVECAGLILRLQDLAQIGGDRSTRIDSFFPGDGTAIATIDVSNTSEFAATGQESADATGPPALVDTLGQRYDAIGYVYKDRSEVRLRFSPGSPLTALTDAPSISRSRDDQQLFLVFRVSVNVKLKQYVIGDKAIRTLPEMNVESQTR